MTLRKARYLSPFTEVAEKGGGSFHRERECSESKSKVLDLEDPGGKGEYRLAGWIRARNNSERTSEVRKSIIPLGIILSISNHNPDKRRFRVLWDGPSPTFSLLHHLEAVEKAIESHASQTSSTSCNSRFQLGASAIF
jgi:hypothetical protein